MLAGKRPWQGQKPLLVAYQVGGCESVRDGRVESEAHSGTALPLAYRLAPVRPSCPSFDPSRAPARLPPHAPPAPPPNPGYAVAVTLA
jgi:hypothetical protein